MANAQANLVRFLDEADKVLIDSEKNVLSTDLPILEHFINRLQILQTAVEKILSDHNESYPTEINKKLEVYQQNVKDIQTQLQTRANTEGESRGATGYQASVERTVLGGRPRFIVTQEQLERLLSLSFSWPQISNILGVSRTTLWRRRSELDLPEKYTELTHSELDDLTSKYRGGHPYSGERELIGYLRALGLRIQRYRIRESIHRIDPINTALRWYDPIKRRPYSVPSPNSLWHIDSNLKLIRWGFVIQGAIDGYSRVCVYVRCNLNNKSETTLKLFMEAEVMHGKPSRVRSDYGSENFGVAKYMLDTRGLNRGSIISGSSTHNNRIERLWKECGRSVIHLYSRIFTFLENADELDLANQVHLFCLQYIFITRINLSLDEWALAWNAHPMSSCGNLSPLQLRERGFLSGYGSSDSAVRHVFDELPSCDLDEYGIDDEDCENKSTQNLELPRVSLSQISHHDAYAVLANISPREDDSNYGIDLYRNSVSALQDHIDSL